MLTADRSPAPGPCHGVGGYAHHALHAALLSALAAGTAHGGTRIEPNGDTATTIKRDGSTTTVSTDTVQGENAFNAFSHFRVGAGHEANLRLPDSASRLINLVHESRAVINGTLNSIENGSIGGDVVFADPHGFLVGASGTLNVGSLGVATPQAQFMDRVIGPDGPNAGAVGDLLSGDFAVAEDASIRIDGEINAEDSVRLLAGQVTVSGSIDVADAGASDDNAQAVFESAVNTEGLARGASIDADEGDVVIAATGNAEVDGQVTADGPAGGGSGGTVVVTAEDSATIGGGATIDVSGTGENADGGQVAVWGTARGVAEAGAEIDADAGTSGDGGLVEVSAGDTVRFADAHVHARGSGGGDAGEFVVDPKEITVGDGTVDGRNDFNGTDVTFTASDSITVQSGAVINTRTTAGGASDGVSRDATATASTGNSGDITLKAPDITVKGDGSSGAKLLAFSTGIHDAGKITLKAGEKTQFDKDIDVTPQASIDVQHGATLDAGARGSGAAGNVELAAFALDFQVSGLADTTADVDMAGRAIGNDISLSATARSIVRQPKATAIQQITTDNDVTDRIEASFDDVSDLSQLTYALPASFAIADAEATTDVAGTADLDAANNVTVDASATREVDTGANSSIAGQSLPIGVAAMYGSIKGTTRAKVASAAEVNAGQDLAVNATSSNSLKAVANAAGGNSDKTGASGTAYSNAQKIGGALAIGHADTRTKAIVRGDVTAGRDVKVAARADNGYETAASFSLDSRGSSSAGLTAALGDYNGDVDARLASDVDVNRDVRVTGESATDGNKVAATTGVSSKSYNKAVKSNTGASRAASSASQGASQGVNEQAKSQNGGSGSGGSGSGGISLGGAVAIGVTDLDAEARIDGGTTVKADRHVAVHSRVKQTGVRSIADSALAVKGASGDSLATISTGISISRHEQDARALIGNEAVVEGGTVGVRSETRMPITIKGEGIDPTQWGSIADAASDLKTAYEVANAPFNLTDKLTSYTRSKAESASKVSLSGSINYLGVDHGSEAWIGNDADVTATGDPDATPEQWSAALDGETQWQYDDRIDVASTSRTALLTGAGVLDKLTGGSQSGSTSAGVGGVFSWVDLDAAVSAGIGDSAVVDAGSGSIGVEATTRNLVVQALPAAGKGASVGIAGVLGLTTVNNTTRAAVADSAELSANDVTVDARQSLDLYGLSGAVILAQQAGVGASAFVHNLESTTEAYVGDLGSDTDNVLPGALDADNAPLPDGGGTITAKAIAVTAETTGRIASLGVAGAKAGPGKKKNSRKGGSGAQRSGQGNQANTAQSTSQGRVDSGGGSGNGSGDTLQSVSGVLQQRSGSSSPSRSPLRGPAGSGSGSGSGGSSTSGQSRKKKGFSFAGAGSAVFNRSRLDTTARIANVTLAAPDASSDTDVTVRALNNTDLMAGAGSGALSMGGSGSKFSSAIAGAAAINWLANDTTAEIVDATANRAGTVSVQAATAGDQAAVGLGLAVSGGGKTSVSIAGSASLSLIRGSTTAAIDGSTLTGVAPGGSEPNATVVAYDESRILTGGGAFHAAAGQQSGGFGAAVTVAAISNATTARIGGSTLSGFNDVGVHALTSSQIMLGAFTGGAGGRVAIGGAFYGAYIGNDLTARIGSDGDGTRADIDAAGTVTVRAEGVDAYAELADELTDSRSTGTWFNGPSGLTNDARLSSVDVATDNQGSTASVFEGDISGEMILGAAVSAQGSSQGAAGGLAFGFNYIDTSYEATIGKADVDTDGDVRVEAANNAAIVGLAVGAAAGTKAAFTGSAVANVIRADVTAQIGAPRAGLAADQYHAVVNADRVDIDAVAAGEIYSFVGSVAASSKIALGASIGYNSIGGRVSARVRAADVTTTGSVTQVEPWAVSVDARRKSAVRTVAASGGAAGKVSIGGSLVASDLVGRLDARIDQGSNVDTASLRVRARDGVDPLSGIWSFAGQIGGAGTAAIGGAFSVNTIARDQTAAITGSEVTASGDVEVLSLADANVRTGAAAGGASGSVAVSGSLTINTLIGSETARVSGGSISAGSLEVAARGGRSIWSLAGAFSASGSAGIGFAGAVNTIKGSRTAEITGTTINAGGGSVDVDTGGTDNGTSRVISAALAAAGGGSAAIGGSLAVNTYLRSETARLYNTTVTADALAVTADEGASEINALAGSVAGGQSGVGAGVTVNTIKNTRRALIDGADLDVADTIDVLAETTGTIRAAGVAGGGGQTVGVAGANTTNVLDATVTAAIEGTRSRAATQDTTVRASDDATILSVGGAASAGGNAGVGVSTAINRIGTAVDAYIKGAHAGGDYRARDMIVEAVSRPDIKTAAISGSAGVQAGLSGSLATNIVTSTTKARIIGGAQVIADDDIAVTARNRAIVRVLGGSASFSGRAAGAATGTFNLLQGDTRAKIAGNGTTVVARGTDPNDNPSVVSGELGDDAPSPSSWSTPGDFSPVSDLGEESEAVNGLALRASSIQQVGVVGVTASGAVPRLTGSGSAAVTGNVNVVGGSTRAAIEDATINPASAGGYANGADVDVGASSHVFNVGYIVAASGGSWVALAGGLDTNVISRTTHAGIHGATVDASDEVVVDADSTQSAASFVVGASGGLGAVSGSVSLGIIRGRTSAAIDNGADVDAGAGGVHVRADGRIDVAVTGGAANLGAAAAGASFGVGVTEATTRARIAGTATSVDTPGGVEVAATTDTGINTNAVTASLGAGAGIAGAGSFAIVRNTTEARVQGAAIGSDASPVGSLDVRATDTVELDTIAGALAIGGAAQGAGAGAGVVVVQSATRAELIDASVDATGNVTVDALREADLFLTSVAGAASTSIGLSGSLGVLVIGDGSVTSDSDDLDSPDSKLDQGGDGTLSKIDGIAGKNKTGRSSRAQHNQPLQASEGKNGNDPKLDTNDGNALKSDDKDALNQAGSYDIAGTYNNRSADQTVAHIKNSDVEAGDSVNVSATNETATESVVGSLGAGGVVGAGLGVGFSRVYGEVTAKITGGSVSADGVAVDATADDYDGGTTALIHSYVGSAGIAAGVSVNLADARVSDTVTAKISGTEMDGTGGDVEVSAADRSSVAANAYGAAVAGGVAVSAVYSGAERDGSVEASLAPSGKLGGFDDVTVDVVSDAPTAARGWAASGGFLAGAAGTVVIADDSVNAEARLAGGSSIDAGGTVTVSAAARPGVTADALGVSLGGGLRMAGSLATANAAPNAIAIVADGVTVEADALSVEAGRGVSDDSAPGTPGNAVGGSFSATEPACPDQSQVGACAFARGGAAGTLLGANATAATADSGGTTKARVGNVDLPNGDVNVGANSATGQYTEATGFAAGIVAVGANVATAKNTTDTRALLDADASMDARDASDDASDGGGDPSDRLAVRAISSNDATGRAMAGSGGVVAGSAASVDTTDEAEVKARLAGGSASSPLTADSLLLQARHDSTYDVNVDSVQAAVVGMSGARAGHDITPTVDAVIAGDGHVTAESAQVLATTEVRKPQPSDYDVVSGSGGVLDAAAVRADSHIAPETTVTLADGARLDVVGDWRRPGNRLVLEAINDVAVDQRIRLDSGGAISVARGESLVDLDNASARVDIGNVDLHTVGDLVAAARTRADLDARANVKTYGGAGAAQGESRTRARVANAVDVGGGADLKSWGQMRLLAGQNASGEANLYDLTARTDLWNKTAFPVETDPVADGIVDQTNTLTVASGASVRSVRDVELAADDGRRLLTGSGTGKDLYRQAAEDIANAVGDVVGAEDVSLEITYQNTSDASADNVTVDGNVAAGVHSEQVLTLNESLDATAQTEGVEFTRETRDLVAELQDRIDELYELKSSYDGVEAARNAFQAEINLLERRLAELSGQGDDTPGQGVQVTFIDLEPILARPGSINVIGDSLAGSGDLRAPGYAEIDINNNGPAFLDVSDLSIPADAGGELTLNFTPVDSNAAINDLNAGNGASFGTVKTAANSDDPLVEVDATFNPDIQDPPDDIDVSDSGTAVDPSIYVSGDIRNLRGKVDMESNTGNVRVSGNIRANTVDIAAGSSLTLSYVDTFRHIGGDPRVDGFGGTTVAANNLIASARYLNINGTLQSGIPAWDLVLDSADETRIEAFRDNYQQWRSFGFEPDPQLKLHDRDNQSGRPAVVYNARKNRIELEGIEVRGGYMELSGKIMNTGYQGSGSGTAGKIKVLDGYGRIDITNNTGYDLHANALDAGNDIEGTLRINDTNAASGGGSATTTVYKRLGNDVRVYEETDSGNLDLLRTNTDSRTASYHPQQDLKFAWLTGTDYRTRTTERRYKDTAIGFISSGEGTLDYRNTVELDSEPLPDGEFLTTASVDKGTVEVNEDDKVRISNREWSECVTSSPGVCWEWRYWAEEVYVQGKTEIDRHYVMADKPIDIEFTGRDTPQINVDNGGAALTLGANVSAPSGQVDVDAGRIEAVVDDAVIQGNDIDLDARRGIANVRVNATGPVRAVSTDGNVGLSGVGNELAIERIAATGGDVRISASGGVVQAAGVSGSSVEGHDVTLRSESGGVGTAGTPVRIDSSSGATGEVNVDAGQQVHLRETAGDLRAERIVGRGGDVGVHVTNGAIVDANTTQTRDERARSELLNAWNDMALRAQDGADAAVDAQTQAYARKQERNYELYWEVRNLRTDDDGNYVVDDFDPDNYDYQFSQQRVSELQNQGIEQAAIDDLEANREKGIEAMHSDVLNNPSAGDYDPAYDYSVKAQDRDTLSQGSVWTTAQLENSVGSGLAKGTTDTTTVIEQENFVAAGRLDLSAARIGAETADRITIDVSGGNVSLTDDQRVALAAAEPDDLEITQDRIEIRQREDVDLDAGGAVTALSGGDVFIGGEQEINVEDVDGSAVRIKTTGNVLTAAPDKAVVTGNRVILESGSGTLGTAVSPVGVDVSGRLTARGSNGVYLKQDSTLTLQRVVSDGSVDIDVDNGDLLPGPDTGIDIQAGGPVTLATTGNLAGSGERLDIGGSPVTLEVGGDAWIGRRTAGGGLADLTLLDSTVGGLLDVGALRGLTVNGVVNGADARVETGSQGTSIAPGARLAADGTAEVRGAHLDMAADGELVGDRVVVDVGGDVSYGDVRARGGGATIDLRVDAGGSIAGAGSGTWLTNDAGLTRLRAGTHIGSAGDPVDVRVDRLHADARDGDLRLHSDQAIAFTDRSSATTGDTTLADADVTAPTITGADLLADRLTVDAGSLAGPRLEARGRPMELEVDAEADLGSVIAGSSATIDAGSLALDTADVATTFEATTSIRAGADGGQDLGTIESDGAMTLAVGGDLDYQRLEGGGTLDAEVAGTATGDRAVFERMLTFTGSGAYDLGKVRSEQAAVVADGVGGAFDVAELRTPNGRIDVEAGSSAIDDGVSGRTVEVVTTGEQDHGTLEAQDALRFEAGIDHAGVDGGNGTGGAAFSAFRVESSAADVHVDAGSAAIERARALAQDGRIRIHTTGDQNHGQIDDPNPDPPEDGLLRADGKVELTAGGTITFREIIAGKDSDTPVNGGDAVLTSTRGSIVGRRIEASRDIVLEALNGRLDLDRLDYGRGYTLRAGRDIIAGIGGNFDSADGQIQAGRHVEIETLGRAGEDGDILLGGLEAKRGHVRLDAAGDIRVRVSGSGDAATTGSVVADDWVDLDAAGETIEVENRIVSRKADVDATAETMELGSVRAPTDVDLDAIREIVVFDVVATGESAEFAGNRYDLDVEHTGGGMLDLEATGPDAAIADHVGLDIDAPGGVDMARLYATEAGMTANAERFDIDAARIPYRMTLDTAGTSILADNRNPATRPVDVQLHEMDGRFRFSIDGTRVDTTAYVTRFGYGYGASVPNFIPDHRSKDTAVTGQSAVRNSLRRSVPDDRSPSEEREPVGTGSLVIDPEQAAPVNLDMAELSRRLRAAERGEARGREL